jgi:hypothetical protein
MILLSLLILDDKAGNVRYSKRCKSHSTFSAEVTIVLAENAGMDPLDAQAQLRAKGGLRKPRYGIDVFNKKKSRRHGGQRHL